MENYIQRILIIDNSVGVTGALKSITQTAYDLKEDFEFQFIIPCNSKARGWIESMGFNEIHEFQFVELRHSLRSILLYLPYLLINSYRLSQLARRNSISIIHVNDIYNLLPAMCSLLSNKIPYVCHIRFMPDRFPALLFNFWFKVHLRYSSQIIAVSKSVSCLLPQHNKLVVIHDRFPLEEKYHRRKPTSEDIGGTFLYISNFTEGKGHAFALEAFSQIHQELVGWTLRFVGGDMGLKKNIKYRGQLKKKAKQLGIYNKTEWIGFTNDVESEYKLGDIVLNFSESESFSLTCLEALFFGRALIATNCGGPSEILGEGEIGILVANRNIEEMAHSMSHLANNKIERDQMGEKARNFVKLKFNQENTSSRVQAIYNSILNR